MPGSGVGAVWPADAVSRRPLHTLTPFANNARTHSPAQIAQIARSLEHWGWTNPVLIDPDGEIIAGHGRVAAAASLGWTEVPVMVAAGWTPEQIRAYRIADNKLAENAGWDEDLLRAEFGDLKAADFDLGLVGFSVAELEQLLLFGEGKDEEETPPPEPQAVAISRTGDLWVLGNHRVICGDSTDPAALARLMAGEVANLIHADPPYGMGKESDGVANDNLYGSKLDGFQMAWWQACRPHLRANASAYIWGNAPDLWRLWYLHLGESEPLSLRNEIVWDKQTIAGMKSDGLTQYPEATERALFFQLGRFVLLINQTADDYWEGWEPIRLWLCGERDRIGWKPGEIKKICGNHMYGHWFGRSQWAFISRENYERLQHAAAGRAFSRPYDDLAAEYNRLAAVFNGEIRDPRAANFEAARPYFDNSHDVMRDVWTFNRVTGEERFGHATPKPVAMMERVMKSSARPGELCLEPFAGTGSTLIGAQKAGRRCYAVELEPRYVDVIVRRWQSMTGQAAVLESSGETFSTVENARTETQADVPSST